MTAPTLENDPYHVESRCPCGKVHSRTLEEAAARHAYHQMRTQSDTQDVDFYQCIHGTWHWTSTTPDPGSCPCGRKAWKNMSRAYRMANQFTQEADHPDVESRAYECFHGGQHTTWYPRRKKYRRCRVCKTTAYPTEEDAATIAAFNHSRGTAYTFTPAQCRNGCWHLIIRRNQETP